MEREWLLASDAFDAFRDKHPELALTGGHWGFHNMLRQNRSALEKADAIRKANGRHWIAHVDRFHRALFDLLTLPAGKQSKPVKSSLWHHQGGTFIPLWSVAFDFGVSEAALSAELKKAGVQVLEVNVLPSLTDKKSLFVVLSEIEDFLLSRVVSAASVVEQQKEQ